MCTVWVPGPAPRRPHTPRPLFGYRLRPELAADFTTLATLLSATMRGLAITALSTPEAATRLTDARPFGAATSDSWSLPAIGMAGPTMAFLEPDPTAEWGRPAPDRDPPGPGHLAGRLS
jgi:hypothetical protein